MLLPKPKAPLNAYNLFFQCERKRILEGTDKIGLPISVEDVLLIRQEYKARAHKRRHRKTHGKIGFHELAQKVARRWRRLDQETRDILEEQALLEKKEGSRLYKAWQAQQDAILEAGAAAPTTTATANNKKQVVQKPQTASMNHQQFLVVTPQATDEEESLSSFGSTKGTAAKLNFENWKTTTMALGGTNTTIGNVCKRYGAATATAQTASSATMQILQNVFDQMDDAEQEEQEGEDFSLLSSFDQPAQQEVLPLCASQEQQPRPSRHHQQLPNQLFVVNYKKIATGAPANAKEDHYDTAVSVSQDETKHLFVPIKIEEDTATRSTGGDNYGCCNSAASDEDLLCFLTKQPFYCSTAGAGFVDLRSPISGQDMDQLFAEDEM